MSDLIQERLERGEARFRMIDKKQDAQIAEQRAVLEAAEECAVAAEAERDSALTRLIVMEARHA